MALTDAQRVKVLGYLGYRLDSIALDSRLDVVTDDFQTEVESLLAELADVDSRLHAIAREVAGLTKVSSVEIAQGQVIRDLEHLGNVLVHKLATALGVPVLRLPYGTGSIGGPGLCYFGA